MKKFILFLVCLPLVFHTSLLAQSEGNIVVIISPELPGIDVLIGEMHGDSKITYLNSAEDPLILITKTIKANRPVRTLHILTESTPGKILFRQYEFSTDSMYRQEDLLGSWEQYFVEDGDILLYGCELAKGDEGMAFVQNLAIVTGLDVAASKDMTGSASLGGDWNLEVRSGEIESRLVVSRNISESYLWVLRSDADYSSRKKNKRLSRSKNAVVSSASVTRRID